MQASSQSSRARLIDIVDTIRHALHLPKGPEVRRMSDETGQRLLRHRRVDPRDLATAANRTGEATRVSRLGREIERICGARVNAHMDFLLAGKPVDVRLSVARLSDAAAFPDAMG